MQTTQSNRNDHDNRRLERMAGGILRTKYPRVRCGLSLVLMATLDDAKHLPLNSAPTEQSQAAWDMKNVGDRWDGLS